MARRPREPEPELDESKRWLDSYADAVTLLLAFFVMMFAFSLVDPVKFTDFKFGVAQALGKPNPALEGGIGLLDRGNGISSDLALPPVVNSGGDGTEGEYQGAGEVTRADLGALASTLQAKLEEQGVEDDVTIEEDPRGLVLKIRDHVLFDSGQALIKLDGARVLAEVANVLRPIDNLIVVEGHTDNVPTRGTQWPTNWELSVARATTVLRWMTEARQIPAVRISAAGYADTRPLASNTSEAGRAQNRRVELVLVVPEDGTPPSLGLDGAAEPPKNDDPVFNSDDPQPTGTPSDTPATGVTEEEGRGTQEEG